MKEKSADQAAEERYLVKIEQEYEKKGNEKINQGNCPGLYDHYLGIGDLWGGGQPVY